MPQAGGAWFDRGTGQRTIRVVYEPGEETQLIFLAKAAADAVATASPSSWPGAGFGGAP
jgi:hypothetical protein